MGRAYQDSRGWKYSVTGGLGEGCFKARYQKPEHQGSTWWKCLRALPWRKTAEEAQAEKDGRLVVLPCRV